MIETQLLTKTYPLGDVAVQALRGIHFSVAAGEFVAIMGPSGSGKSTLLHLLGGLDHPTSGEIILDGRPFSRLDDDAITLMRRRQIGFIFQFFNLLPTLTARENIALPLLLDGQSPAQHRSRIDDLLALVDLAERQHHKPHQLSGGQQQRVAIARALVTQPKLVLADEPTGNLDSQSGAAILRLLRRACDEKGQTIVMVTHDKHAAAIADRVIFLKDGQIIHDLDFDSVNSDRTRTQEISLVANTLDN